MPRHRWNGTKLQFEQGPDGDEWGAAVDLQGPARTGVQNVGASSFRLPSVNSYFPSGW
jgi:hypothetical protein